MSNFISVLIVPSLDIVYLFYFTGSRANKWGEYSSQFSYFYIIEEYLKKEQTSNWLDSLIFIVLQNHVCLCTTYGFSLVLYEITQFPVSSCFSYKACKVYTCDFKKRIHFSRNPIISF